MADQGNVFSFEAARAQYEVLFMQEDRSLPAVKALCGGFKNSGVRGLVWKVLLGLLPPDDERSWPAIIAAKRAAYVALSARHVIKQSDLVAEDGDPLDNNPLMQNEDSLWTKYFAQVEIEKEIKKDLERIFPEFEFFQQPAIQDMMLRVLLVWSKLNCDVGYRQGMHELLGPLLMTVVNSSFSAAEEQLAHPLATLCSAEHVEADSYLLFEIMMHKMKDMFAVSVAVKSLPGQPPVDYRLLTLCCVNSRPSSADDSRLQPVLRMSCRIYHVILRAKDPELYSHLQKCSVEPQLFLLKWIRLMFGRNFHLDDVVILWDAIFAQAYTSGGWMEMIELLSVAMIMYIRGDLLQKQAHAALQRLMKFPPVESVNTFVDRAIQLKNPEFHQPSAPHTSVASSVSSSVGSLASKTAAGLASAFSHHQTTPGKLPSGSSSSSRAPSSSSSTTSAVSRSAPASAISATSPSESPPSIKPIIIDSAATSSIVDYSQTTSRGPSAVAIGELAQNVTMKVQKAIDILEGSLNFDDLMKVNEALCQLQDVKMHLMEWLPKEARARGLPQVAYAHPAREASNPRGSVPSADDDPLA